MLQAPAACTSGTLWERQIQRPKTDTETKVLPSEPHRGGWGSNEHNIARAYPYPGFERFVFLALCWGVLSSSVRVVVLVIDI